MAKGGHIRERSTLEKIFTGAGVGPKRGPRSGSGRAAEDKAKRESAASYQTAQDKAFTGMKKSK